ncbi:Xaa-Pro aminopeptidase [Congregibacter variabilis]|uniref:Xaa-Pro aminopeptidase n=1 Tax=Congregibacter variabilis TaxID=3081200 RepID=A0ABZ0HZK2_9GAMM|nr:Xaa-Pro aminopeptidase [Congregibacter sp. IMCC43200]
MTEAQSLSELELPGRVANIPRGDFRRRRHKLLGMLEQNSIAIVTAGALATRSRDTEFPFRQDSDFHYLTGFPEPDAVAVFLPGREYGEYVLFCHEKDAQEELWNGERVGADAACERYGADDAFPLSDIDDILVGLIEGRDRVYYSMGRSREFDTRVMAWVNSIRSKVAAGAAPPGEFTDLDHLLHEQRLFKSAAEVRQMRQAAAITVQAHRRAMRQCRPGMYEYQLEAELLHEFARHGARHAAYPSIVAGGANACTMHYIGNHQRLKRGDLVLIDAGCEYRGYAADITRTFPVSGHFSKRQRALYELTLAAQQAAFDALAPGRDWNAAHCATVDVITSGLVDLGLLRGNVSRLIKEGAYQDFYMHRVGHWLGLDVHDVGDYRPGGQWRQLEPGMALTVEPGIYVSPDNLNVPAAWRGIGVRIEDDVIITEHGYELLSDGLPRTSEEVEEWMQ